MLLRMDVFSKITNLLIKHKLELLELLCLLLQMQNIFLPRVNDRVLYINLRLVLIPFGLE